MIWALFRFLFDSAFMLFVFYTVACLFLEYRYSKKYHLVLVIVISIAVTALCCLLPTSLPRMLCGNGCCMIALLLLYNGSVVQKLGMHILYMAVLVFSEAIILAVFQAWYPGFNRLAYVPIDPSSGFIGILENYSISRSVGTIFCVAFTFFIMLILYAYMKRRDLKLSGKTYQPFIIFTFLQVVMFQCINMADPVETPSNPLPMLAIQGFMLCTLIWILWQITVTALRNREEDLLSASHMKSHLDYQYFEQLREKSLEIGKFRHDFNNHAQTICFLMERGNKEDLARAEKMLTEMIQKVEKLS